MFPHAITIQWSDEADAYVARVEAAKVTAKGDTPEAALRAVLIAAGVEVPSERSAAASAMGRAGGAKGGAARAASLTKKARREIAKKAAKARWSQVGSGAAGKGK